MQGKSDRQASLKVLASSQETNAVLVDFIMQYAHNERAITILEAGCGKCWDLDLPALDYTLTGVDNDPAALAIRQCKTGDLDIAIQGDLQQLELDASAYDIIYCSYVLEHINGAATVLENFTRWLKPGGLMLIKVPDRESAFGFITRHTPFWLHVAYKRYVQGNPDAGKPGHDPFPTYYDDAISRRGIRRFSRQHGLIVRAEYGMGGAGYFTSLSRIYRLPVRILLWLVYALSFGSLAAGHKDLLYVIEKSAGDRIAGSVSVQ